MTKKGFTLVELMIVITVIAILSTIGVVYFSKIQTQARDVKRKADMRTLVTALQSYLTDKTTYPTTSSFGGSDALFVPAYLPKVPVDPKAGYTYTYHTGNVANPLSTFALCAKLENPVVATNLGWKVTSNDPAGSEVAEDPATCAAPL